MIDFNGSPHYDLHVMSKDKVKTITHEIVFQGYHRLEIHRFQPKSLHGENWLDPMQREVFRLGPVASALLYCPETDEVLLNEQFRAGPWLAGDPNPWLLECCAGAIDKGEAPEQAARREALEETGMTVTDIEPIGTAYTSPGCIDERFYLFCGRIENPKSGGIHGLIEEGEEIKTHLMPSAEAIALLDAGKITNVTTALCLQWFARHHDKIRTKWLKKEKAA